MIEVLNSPNRSTRSAAASALQGKASVGRARFSAQRRSTHTVAAAARSSSRPIATTPSSRGRSGAAPGRIRVSSPTDAFRAIRAGAHALKLFPAEVLGAKGIKAIKAVLPPEMPLYAVGGATPENFAEFLAAGCTGFGIGSYLYKPGAGLAAIAAGASAIVAAYDRAKGRPAA
jgi:2-dehydro-3-deoxyphosphogalactonate aldolase